MVIMLYYVIYAIMVFADTEGLILDDQINNIAYSKGISVQELDGSIERNRAMKKKESKCRCFQSFVRFEIFIGSGFLKWGYR